MIIMSIILFGILATCFIVIKCIDYSERKAEEQWYAEHPRYNELLTRKKETADIFITAKREWYYEPAERIDTLIEYKKYTPTEHHIVLDREIRTLQEYIYEHEAELERLRFECEEAEEQFSNYIN